jgi:hypothetical protein
MKIRNTILTRVIGLGLLLALAFALFGMPEARKHARATRVHSQNHFGALTISQPTTNAAQGTR